MVGQLHSLFEKYSLMDCMIASVKDEGNNIAFHCQLLPFETLVGL
jgi:hypothetical protein